MQCCDQYTLNYKQAQRHGTRVWNYYDGSESVPFVDHPIQEKAQANCIAAGPKLNCVGGNGVWVS